MLKVSKSKVYLHKLASVAKLVRLSRAMEKIAKKLPNATSDMTNSSNSVTGTSAVGGVGSGKKPKTTSTGVGSNPTGPVGNNTKNQVTNPVTGTAGQGINSGVPDLSQPPSPDFVPYASPAYANRFNYRRDGGAHILGDNTTSASSSSTSTATQNLQPIYSQEHYQTPSFSPVTGPSEASLRADLDRAKQESDRLTMEHDTAARNAMLSSIPLGSPSPVSQPQTVSPAAMDTMSGDTDLPNGSADEMTFSATGAWSPVSRHAYDDDPSQEWYDLPGTTPGYRYDGALIPPLQAGSENSQSVAPYLGFANQQRSMPSYESVNPTQQTEDFNYDDSISFGHPAGEDPDIGWYDQPGVIPGYRYDGALTPPLQVSNESAPSVSPQSMDEVDYSDSISYGHPVGAENYYSDPGMSAYNASMEGWESNVLPVEDSTDAASTAEQPYEEAPEFTQYGYAAEQASEPSFEEMMALADNAHQFDAGESAWRDDSPHRKPDVERAAKSIMSTSTASSTSSGAEKPSKSRRYTLDHRSTDDDAIRAIGSPEQQYQSLEGDDLVRAMEMNIPSGYVQEGMDRLRPEDAVARYDMFLRQVTAEKNLTPAQVSYLQRAFRMNMWRKNPIRAYKYYMQTGRTLGPNQTRMLQERLQEKAQHDGTSVSEAAQAVGISPGELRRYGIC